MTTGGMQAASAQARRWVLALTSVASLMVVLDALVVSTALNTIRVHLGTSVEELGWMVNAYTLSFAVLLMPAAAVGDRLGRRRVFTAGLGLFVAASAACALATGAGWLIAARAVQGAGAALVMPHALALLSVAFPPSLRPKALGMFSAVTGLAVPLGPLLGGAVVQGISWPWIFWLNVPIGLVTIMLIAGPGLAYWQMVAPLVISGAGVAMASPAAQSAVLSSSAPQDIGKASGAFSTMRQLGGAFGVAVLVAVFGRAGSYASAQAFTDGFVPAIGACAALSLTGAIAGLFVPSRRAAASTTAAQAAFPVQDSTGAPTEPATRLIRNPAAHLTVVTKPTTRKAK